MKKYIKPDMSIELFENEDVITTSGEGTISARKLKTWVNGNEGTDYGSQGVDFFK